MSKKKIVKLTNLRKLIFFIENLLFSNYQQMVRHVSLWILLT